MTSSKYTIEDFQKIIWNGFNCSTVDHNAIRIISEIADKVGAPSYIKTPIFPKRNTDIIPTSAIPKRAHNKKPQQISDEDWNGIRMFQKTELKTTEGINKRVDNIRGLLNKLTDVTYDLIMNNIVDEINEIKRDQNNTQTVEDMACVAKHIFTTASTNSFYSATYAKLFKRLISEDNVFFEIFNQSFNEHGSLFKTVEYVDPKEDYSKYCSITKTNDVRRAMSDFIVNLMKERILEVDKVGYLIAELQNDINSYMKQPNKTNEVEEMTENIFILITKSKEHLVNTQYWDDIQRNVQNISLLKVKMKEFPSITNKTIFKHMDILEEIEN